MMASARSTAQVAETSRQGVGIMRPGTPAATRLENVARYLDFISEAITRAAEQAREILHTSAAPASDGTAGPGPGPA